MDVGKERLEAVDKASVELNLGAEEQITELSVGEETDEETDAEGFQVLSKKHTRLNNIIHCSARFRWRHWLPLYRSASSCYLFVMNLGQSNSVQ